MALWVWLVAYLVGFALLQVLLYRYFQEDSARERTAPSSSERSRAAPETRSDDAGSGLHCKQCGAYNDAGYSYCRQCAGQL
jgi:hypothetical protein